MKNTLQIKKDDLQHLPMGATVKIRSSASVASKSYEIVYDDDDCPALHRAGKTTQFQALRDYKGILMPYDIIELESIPEGVLLSGKCVDLLPAGTEVNVQWYGRSQWERHVIGKAAGKFGASSFTTKLDADGNRRLAEPINLVGTGRDWTHVKVVSLP